LFPRGRLFFIYFFILPIKRFLGVDKGAAAAVASQPLSLLFFFISAD